MSATGALPIWLTRIQKGGGKLSDIEYMARIANGEIGGSTSERVFVRGEIAPDTTGEIVSYTPASGKDFYLAHAGITPEGTAGDINSIVVEVQNDTNVRDILGGWSSHNVAGGGNEGGQGAPFFKSVSGAFGEKLIGNSSKKFSLNCETNLNVRVTGVIIGFIIDNGQSPSA